MEITKIVSNYLTLFSYIIIFLAIIVYFSIEFLINWRKNPDSIGSQVPIVSRDENGNSYCTSSVTYTNLGKNGDMGNQIFQLSSVIASGERSNAKIILPTCINKLPIFKLFDLTKYETEDIYIDQPFYEHDNYEEINIPNNGRNFDIRGYRQAYKYFEDHSEIIKRTFTPKKQILDKVREILPKQYICLHIRKGDYIKLIHNIPFLREFKNCKIEYYKAAVKKLREFYPNCPLLVCTDSPKFVKPLLEDIDSNATLAPIPEGIDPKFSDFCTLYLSNGNVISNSTYSWMASYLGKDKEVICPDPWWDSEGFIGKYIGLDGPYLHYYKWWILNADTGDLIREPYGIDKEDNNNKTLSIIKLIRGMLL